MEEKQEFEDIKTHLQITVPIEGNYRIDKYNFTFGNFKRQNTLLFALETFILSAQYFYQNPGLAFRDTNGYITFWNFGDKNFYTLSINDITGTENMSFTGINNSLQKLIKKQRSLSGTDWRFDHSLLFYAAYCNDELRNPRLVLSENFTDNDIVMHDDDGIDEGMTIPSVHIRDIFNYTNTELIIRKKFKITLNENMENFIVNQYFFPIKLLFQKSFFHFKMPLNNCNIYLSKALEEMKQIARKYCEPDLFIPEPENDINYKLHSLRFNPEFDDLDDDDDDSDNNDETQQEKRAKEEKRKARNLMMKTTFNERIQLEQKKKKIKKPEEWNNIFLDWQWSLLSEDEQMLKNTLLLLKRIITRTNNEIEQLQKQIDHKIATNYPENRILIKSINDLSEKMKQQSLTNYRLSQIHYEQNEIDEGELENYKRQYKEVIDKIERFWDIAYEQEEKNDMIDNDDLLELIEKHVSIENTIKEDESINNLMLKIEQKKRENIMVYKNWCSDNRVREVMSKSMKSVVQNWNDEIFQSNYQTISFEEIDGENDVGIIFRKKHIQNIDRLLGLRYTLINFQLIEHMIYSTFNYWISNVLHLFMVGAKGKGKSETCKVARDSFLPNLIIYQSFLPSPKFLTGKTNPINNSILWIDEVPDVFISKESDANNGKNNARADMKTLLQSDRVNYTVFAFTDKKKGGKGNAADNRTQLTMSNHVKNGFLITGNTAPPRNDPLPDRLLIENIFVDDKNIINLLVQTLNLLKLDKNFKREKDLFLNSLKLKQTVLLNFFMYSSAGMFGSKIPPYTDQVTCLLNDNILKKFCNVFKTYDYGPRSMKRLQTVTIGVMYERIFAELFLLENSRYRYNEEKGFIYDHIKYSDINEREEPHVPGKEEVFHQIMIRSYTNINDLCSALSLTNCERLNKIEKEITQVLFDRLLMLTNYSFVKRINGKSLKRYFDEKANPNKTLGFRFVRDTNEGIIYDPNFIVLYFGKSKREAILEIQSNLSSHVVPSQVEAVIDGFKKHPVNTSISYKKVIHKIKVGDDSVYFHPPTVGNATNQTTTVQGIRGNFCSELYYKGKFSLQFNVHGLKDFLELKESVLFDKFKDILKNSFESMICFDKKLFIFDSKKREVISMKDHIVDNSDRVCRINKIKVPNPYYRMDETNWNIYHGANNLNSNDYHLNKLLKQINTNQNFEFSKDIDEISEKIHFERMKISEEEIRALKKERYDLFN